jgi:tetratricopeptide (TPR) repeat protein
MTNKELKEAILSAKAPNWFENIALDLNFSAIGLQQNLKGFTSIYQYFQTQLEGWKSFGENIPQVLKSSFVFFNTVYPILNQIATNAKNYEENQLTNTWHNVNNAVSRNQLQITLTYDCPETDFILKINEEQSSYVNDVFNFLIAFSNNQGIQPNNPKSFTAYLLAYEFIQKDHTNITERRNSEKSSLSRLRNDFQKYLSTSEEQLNQFLQESKQKSEDYAKAIDETKEAKEIEFKTWYNEVIEKHEAFTKETIEHRDNLEKTYREVLRLKEPADYWKIRALKLQKQGRTYMNLLISLVVFSAGLLFFLLHTIPNGSIENIFNDAGKAIKWSIVLISFLSFLAYGVRLLAKASFSAFHLARDAEEREHLTYLYLSLRKDGNVSDEDRQMVLQSLFSRADTGLLKEDSSPSMPGSATSIVEKVIMKP